jgi:23S rRNA pseudouridine1911/1915/1917 synthase
MKKLEEDNSNEIIEEEKLSLLVSEEDLKKFKRLDHFLSNKITNYSRTFLKGLFQMGKIGAENKNTKSRVPKLELKKMPPPGTIIYIEIPPPIPIKAKAEDIPLEILYEDDHLVFVNKPAGLVTHPAPGHYTGTLVNAILHHCPNLGRIGNSERPGIVHRLDKGTSGVMVVAKNQKTLEGLIELFSKHDINRVYEALVIGTKLPPKGTLESNIGRHPRHRQKMACNVNNGKEATTYFKALNFFNSFTHMQLKLETGRTHQIRVHLSSLLNAPIICDPLYGNPSQHIQRLGNQFAFLKNYPHPLLHAKTLGLIHPITKKELSFTVQAPETFNQVLDLGFSS